MKKSPLNSKSVSQGILKRRRALPIATTAAALGIAGCGMMASTPGAADSTPAPSHIAQDAPAVATTASSPGLSPRQRATEQLVQAYTSNLDVALDQVDRERLRAGERKAAAPPVPAVAATPTPPAVPASIVQPQMPGQPAVTPAAAPAATPNLMSPGNLAIASTLPPATPTVVQVTTSVVSPTASAPLPVLAAPAVAAPAAPLSAPAAPVPIASAPVTPAAHPAIKPPSATPPITTPAPVSAHSNSVASPATPSAMPKVDPAAPVVASGISSEKVSDAVIAPIGVQATSSSAMGAMSALVASSPDNMPDVTPSVAPPAIKPAAEPAPVAAVVPAQEPSIEEAMAIVRKRAAEHPSLNTALALALLDAGSAAKSDDLTKSLPDSDQKVYADLLAALERMNAPAGAAPAATLADRAAPLVQAAQKWQADADLALPHLVLATRVDSFGVYTAVEPKFEQGKRQTVIIYCEVGNFASKKAEDGWFQTNLTQQETLITEDGLMVWRSNVEDVDDRSMNQRHDFYLVKKLTIPETLTAGKYTLRMKVADRNSNKSSNVGLTIEIVGK